VATDTSCYIPPDPTGQPETAYANYDNGDQLTSASDADGRTWTYTLDAQGQLTATQNPTGSTITQTFDGLGRVTDRKELRGGTLLDENQFTFDGDGQRTQMSDPTSHLVTSYTFYNPGWLASVSQSGAGPTRNLDYTYDANGNMTSLGYEGDGVVTYSYTNQSQIRQIDYSGSCPSGTCTPSFDYTYDDAGNVTQLTASATATVGEKLAYTSLGDLSSIAYQKNPDQRTPTNDLTLSYGGYDAAGNPGSEAVSGAASATTTFNYDNSYRVTTDSSVGTAGSPPASFSYDGANDITGRNPATSQSFDPAGQLLSSGQASIGYDGNGRRAGSSGPVIGCTSSCATETASYSWDPMSNLQSAALSASDGSVAVSDSYGYNGDGVRISTTDSSGASTYYLYDPSASVPRLLYDGTWNYLYGYSSVPIAQVNPSTGEVDLLARDGESNVRAVIALNQSNAGKVINCASYDAYGEPSASGGLTVPHGGSFTGTTAFGFGGGYTDETGLVYLIHRYYDPQTGQFLSVDPLQSLTAAGYSYAGDNPLMATDPTGMYLAPGPDSSEQAWERAASLESTLSAWQQGITCGGACMHWIVEYKLAHSPSDLGPEPGLFDDVGAGLEGAANFGAGVANVGAGVVSFGHLHVGQAFGGPGERGSYDIGEGWASFATIVAPEALAPRLVRLGTLLRGGEAARAGVAADGESGGLSEAFHYTGSRNVASIEANGLRAGSYATPNGELSGLQAQIDLALPPNRGLSGGLIRIDLAGLRQAGYEIPDVTQVGRKYNMPGGGYEMQFSYPIPSEFLKVIAP
jgi:RHS repeat-associated protein